MATEQELDAIEGKLLAQIGGFRQQLAAVSDERADANRRCGAMMAERDSFEQSWRTASELAQMWKARAEQAEAERDQLRQQLADVPVVSIETAALWALENSPPDYVSYACKIIAGWIGGAQFAKFQIESKPSPVVAFAELQEKYHQYFDAVLGVTDAPEAQP